MANITDLGNNKYRIIISNGFKPNGKRNRITKTIEAKSKKELDRKVKILEGDFVKGEIKDKENWTFKELVDEWRRVDKPKGAPRTIERYEQIIESSLLPNFGRRKVKDITTIEINRYIASLGVDGVRKDGKSGGYSLQTQKHYYTLLNTLFNRAKKWEIITSNPCDNVDVPKVQKVEAKYYEETDIEKLLRLIETEDIKYKAFFHIALFSGCRRSEILGLEWKDFDFEKNTVKIRRTSHKTKDSGIITRKILKSDSARRTITLPNGTVELMKEYKKHRDEQNTKLEKLWKDGERLFVQQNGLPMDPGTPYDWLKKLITKHGLKYINIHGFRHTHVSVLINGNMDIVSVSKRVGHADVSTTMNRYAHMMEGADYEGARQMEKFYSDMAI